MKLNIANNIRASRHEMGFTQEQLAEALGVTVGAVSKWESGANSPDISLIAELADFFGMSVDALLGYDMCENGAEALRQRITDLAMNRRFDEARVEMDKALAKYPNNFNIARVCANTYALIGVELSDDTAHRKQLELYQRSLTLISQNTDPNFSEWSIQNRIAEAHCCLGEYDKALDIMKKNNAQGVNNCNIAAVLVENCDRYAEGLSYMSDDLVYSVIRLTNDAVTGAFTYVALGRPDDAERMVNWTTALYEGLAADGKACHVQRGAARLKMFAAFAALAAGRRSAAVEYLKASRKLLCQYMATPDNSLSGTWIENGEKYRSFDDLGDDVLIGARIKLEKLQGRLEKYRAALHNFDQNGPTLQEMWDELV